MSRQIKRAAAGWIAFLMAFCMLWGRNLTAYAATGKITFSDPTVTVGNQVSVSMKIAADGALGASDVMLQYDSSALQFLSGTNANGGAGSVRVVGSMESANQTTFSFTLKFKALKAGTSTIKVQSYEVYDSDSHTVSVSHVGSSAVKINAPVTYSSEAALSDLTVSPGELSPAFSPEVTEYTVTVPGNTEKLTVSAPAKDSKASVSVSGNEDLKVGENTVTCKVTAEDGTTTRTYTIVVTKTEGGSEEEPQSSVDANATGSGVLVTMDEGIWQVAESFDAAALPAGFTQTEYTYNGTQVQAGVDDKGILLLYMTDENGNGDFFVYEKAAGILSPYVTVSMSEKTILVLPPERIPEGTALPSGFAECTIDIGTHTVHGWIWENGNGDAPEYCVVYGMNENGEESFYRYDQKEMTMQRYFQDPDAEDIRSKYIRVAEDYNSLLADYDTRGYLIAGLFGVCILLVIIIVVLLLTRRSGGSPKRRYDDFYDDDEPERVQRPSPQRKAASDLEALGRRQEARHVSAPKEPKKSGAEKKVEARRERLQDDDLMILDLDAGDDLEIIDLDDEL